MRFLFAVLLFLLLFPQKIFSNDLKGSRESLQKQNEVARKLNLPRVENVEQLEELKRKGAFVPIPESVLVDERIPKEFRYVRLATAKYIDDLALRFINTFGRQLQVNSAVRTVEYQNELQKINQNAAPVNGDRASTHTTGSTIDIGKKGLSETELNFLREEFLLLETKNLIEATEEWSQLVFHVMVFDWLVESVNE